MYISSVIRYVYNSNLYGQNCKCLDAFTMLHIKTKVIFRHCAPIHYVLVEVTSSIVSVLSPNSKVSHQKLIFGLLVIRSLPKVNNREIGGFVRESDISGNGELDVKIGKHCH